MLEILLSEVRELSKVLENWSESLHAEVDITPGLRSLLELFATEGAMTVPAAARVRGASRQHIQQMVDSLAARKLVIARPNPAHKRSPLISYTDRGRALVENMRADERNALLKLRAGTSDHALKEATQVLSAWKVALSDDLRDRATDGSSS